ncbi:MAG: sugar ABC transporter substrate-binding protein, partial [Chloroflexi bacterium]
MMKLFDRKRKTFAILASMVLLALLASACGSANTGSSSNTPTSSGNNGKGCKKVGVLLPETATSARWDSKDRPLLTQGIKNALSGATVDYNNAEGSATEQQNQANADLTKGDCILVLAPVNG